MDPSEKAVSRTRSWLTETVIGLNLCPFAERPTRSESVRITSSIGLSVIDSAKSFGRELELLMQQDSESLETTLLILDPVLFADFDSFLGFLEQMNLELEENELLDEFQIVGFHPQYQFEGEEELGRSNYTNRSPYPMLHILRQASMSAAISAYGERETEQIPDRNIELLESMDSAGFEALKRRVSGD